MLNNATSVDDMIDAYLHRLLTEMEKTHNYSDGAAQGVDILNKYDFEIPKKITKTCIVKEEMKLKLAMRNKSYSSCLSDLPLCQKKYDPMFKLLRQLQLYSMFSGNDDLAKIVVWKSVQFAIKHGMGRTFPTIIGFYAILLLAVAKLILHRN